MYERIVEIIVRVVSELKRKKEFSAVDIRNLEKRGYTDNEISAAFSWIVDRMEFAEKLFPLEEGTKADSFRILDQAEKDLFTPEALGEMIQLHTLGIISNENIESLLEKATYTGAGSIDSQHLKWFVAHAIFSIHTQDQPGSRIMLTGSDAIN